MRRASSSAKAWPGKSPSVASIIRDACQYEDLEAEETINSCASMIKRQLLTFTYPLDIIFAVPQILILNVLASQKRQALNYNKENAGPMTT